jgi:hypothetical protein
MSDPNSQWQVWVTGLQGVLLAVFAYVLQLYRSRVDYINENYVSKAALEGYLEQMRKEKSLMHMEDLASFREIRASIDRVHERIDGLYQEKRQ